jgi:kynurenine formamidase
MYGACHRTLLMRVTLFLVLLSACQPRQAALDPFSRFRWVDLTHDFSSETIYWPTARPFRLDSVFQGTTAGGFWYEANNFAAAEHGGTHLDAPVHFAEGKETTDRVPLQRLIGPAVVIDVSDSTAANPDYQVRRADLERWAASGDGARAHGAIVLIRTGWGRRWPDRQRYLGTTKTGDEGVKELHFPGIAPEAAELLAGDWQVAAVGIDTPSLDYGQSQTYSSHQILFRASIPGFENVANLDSVPATGAYVIALPMKILGGSGGPLRIVAAVPDPGLP